MANVGATATSSAHFALYPGASLAPAQVTVAPDTTTTDTFEVAHGSHYDVTVIGPNRFLRRLTGDARGPGHGLEVATRIAGAPERLWLDLRNDTAHAATITVTSNNYRTDGPWTYRLAAGARASQGFNVVSHQHGWYDFTVTCSADSSWSRRVVGHLETGQPSITG